MLEFQVTWAEIEVVSSLYKLGPPSIDVLSPTEPGIVVW